MKLIESDILDNIFCIVIIIGFISCITIYFIIGIALIMALITGYMPIH